MEGHHSKVKSQGPCEKEYEKYCLNGGERYFLVEEFIVCCNYPWLSARKSCENYMWWR